MIYGSFVFLVVRTVIEPSMRFNSQAIPQDLEKRREEKEMRWEEMRSDQRR